MFTDDESGFYDNERFKLYTEEIMEIILDAATPVTVADIHRAVNVAHREWTAASLESILSSGLVVESGYRHYAKNYRDPLEMPEHSMMPATVDHTLPVNAFAGRKD